MHSWSAWRVISFGALAITGQQHKQQQQQQRRQKQSSQLALSAVDPLRYEWLVHYCQHHWPIRRLPFLPLSLPVSEGDSASLQQWWDIRHQPAAAVSAWPAHRQPDKQKKCARQGSPVSSGRTEQPSSSIHYWLSPWYPSWNPSTSID